jgi:hypothetical protein
MYVYINSEPSLYTVGFYSPDGQWHPDSDHQDRKEAAQRVAWLNGSETPIPLPKTALNPYEQLMESLKAYNCITLMCIEKSCLPYGVLKINVLSRKAKKGDIAEIARLLDNQKTVQFELTISR